MQAHLQSSPAARDSLHTSQYPAAPVLPKPEVTPSPAASIAQGVGLAHDAGNLLAALGLYCDLLDAPGVLRPEHRHYIDELRLIAERSSRMIHTLLARPTTPAPAAASTTAPVGSPPSNAAATLREIEPLLAAIAKPSATLVCKAPRTLPTPGLPSEALERILVNLVRNAAQAIESAAEPQNQGHIRITLATLAGHLRLTVEDNGPGMPVPTAAAFLSPSPLPPGARHGFGHRIIHNLVASSGGALSLRVRPGRGTAITIQWPGPSNASRPALPGPEPRGQRRPGVVPC